MFEKDHFGIMWFDEKHISDILNKTAIHQGLSLTSVIDISPWLNIFRSEGLWFVAWIQISKLGEILVLELLTFFRLRQTYICAKKRMWVKVHFKFDLRQLHLHKQLHVKYKTHLFLYVVQLNALHNHVVLLGCCF